MPIADPANDWQDEFPLDPFGAAPLLASRIAGLGGDQPAMEAGYTFRTLPVASPVTAAAMRIELHDLRAEQGSLAVDLDAIPARPGAAPVRLATVVMPLEEMRERGGVLIVPFEARPGMLYAVAGYIHDDGFVGASKAEVALIARTGPAVAPAFDASGVEPVALPRLTSQDEPDFRAPVSQPMTRAQCRHPDFRRWTRELGLAAQVEAPDNWPIAFALQVLVRYGALRPGARGLCLHGSMPGLAAALGRRGCQLLASARDIAPDAAELPVRGFDFVLSLDLDAGSDVLRQAIRTGLDRLAPGGFAIHIFTLGQVQRAEVERIALDTIASGHEVAQLKFGSPDRRPYGATGIPFGFINRRT